MKNLIKALQEENLTNHARYVEKLNNPENGWVFSRDAPKLKSYEKLTTKEERIAFISERYKKELDKRLAEEVSRLKSIMEADELISMTITIEWKRSRMWGYNPKATGRAKIQGKEYVKYDVYESGSIGGCGYDKKSTAVAEILNQCTPLIKLLCIEKDKSSDKKNQEVFGYGAGYGILPRFEGGVGVECYPDILKKIGYKFENTAWTDTLDVFLISKI